MSDNTRDLVAMLASEFADLAHSMGRRANTRAAQMIVAEARRVAAHPSDAQSEANASETSPAPTPVTSHSASSAAGMPELLVSAHVAQTPAPTPTGDTRRWVAWKDPYRRLGGVEYVAWSPTPSERVFGWTAEQLDETFPSCAPHTILVPATALEAAQAERDEARAVAEQKSGRVVKLANEVLTRRAELAQAKRERDDAKQCARYESDVAKQAVAEMDTLRARVAELEKPRTVTREEVVATCEAYWQDGASARERYAHRVQQMTSALATLGIEVRDE